MSWFLLRIFGIASLVVVMVAALVVFILHFVPVGY
jgi:hypothetical protein